MTNRKYTLFKNTGDGSVKPCAFFLSPAGCKNGDKCKFAHIKNTSFADDPIGISGNNSMSSSDISSESEDGSQYSPPAQPKIKTKQNVKQKSTPTKQLVKHVDDTVSDDLFASPGKNSSTPILLKRETGEGKKKRKTKPENSDPFARPKRSYIKRPIDAGDLCTNSTPTPVSRKKSKSTEKISDFRNLNLPITSFSIPSNGNKIETIDQLKSPTLPAKYPLPTSTPEGMRWKDAVIATRNNPKYKADFSFDKVKLQQKDWQNGDTSNWITARPFGAWCANNPQSISIDCEMCETCDIASGKRNPKALCRLSVVNASNPDEVLIDTLVKPTWPVTDYRSKINGINKEHLETVQFTLKHAQAFMTALCSNETVIIGHAVHNDLIALQFEHHCNVDSAMLFSVKDEPNSTCSLKDLAMTVLTREMPKVHDSVNDARVALLSITAGYLETGGSPELIIRSSPTKRNDANSELFVHRIPKGCYPEHISNMFVAHTCVQPKDVPKIEFNSDTGKTTVSFTSADHANLAFNTLDGEAKPDKTGRLQKRVYLRSGGYVCIRKMSTPKKH